MKKAYIRTHSLYEHKDYSKYVSALEKKGYDISVDKLANNVLEFHVEKENFYAHIREVSDGEYYIAIPSKLEKESGPFSTLEDAIKAVHKLSIKEEIAEAMENKKLLDLGRKLQVLASKEKNDTISVSMARLGDAIEDWGTPFGPKSIADLSKKTGLSQQAINMLIKKAQAASAVKESTTTEKNNKIFEIGRKLQRMAAKEKNDTISVSMARLADAIEDWNTPFGPKSMADLSKKSGLSQQAISMLIKKAEAAGLKTESLEEAVMKEVSLISQEQVQSLADKLKNDYGFVTSVKKSTLGGSPSYFLFALSPKNTWVNGIADNAPVYINFHIFPKKTGGYTVEVNRFSYQLKNVGVKAPRKFDASDFETVEKNILKYFTSNFSQIKKLFKESVEVISEKYTVNHKDFSSAVQHAIKEVEKKGFQVDTEDWDNKVATGPKKPSAGNTNRYIIKLLKDGKETRRTLHMQIYNADNKFYELNMYID
jgi:biotin operon repressor